MRLGLNGGAYLRSPAQIGSQAASAARDGFASYWLSQVFGPDSLTAFAALGTAVPNIEFGTAIVPTYSRHPLALAMQALTVQAATGSRLVLGIGPSHPELVRRCYGGSYEDPVGHTREYLRALRALVRGEPYEASGPHLTVAGQLTIDAPPPPILLAALGPRMLELAGAEADGTVTWMVGPSTLRKHTVPAITAAAELAGRPAPRVVVGIQACVTDDLESARAAATIALEQYARLPAYRAMLDMEGVAEPAELLITGHEDDVTARIMDLADAGATDLRVTMICPKVDDEHRTRAYFRSLNRRFSRSPVEHRPK